MNNIDEKINLKEHERDKYERKVKFWRFIYKFVGFLHIGSAGTFAVNAAKELLSQGSLSGLLILGGLFTSFFVSAAVLDKVVSYYQDKKTKVDIDLIVLNKEKTMFEKREERRKERERKRIITNINHISHNNNYIQENANEMKLTLGRK